jgi:hypothetical protein
MFAWIVQIRGFRECIRRPYERMKLLQPPYTPLRYSAEESAILSEMLLKQGLHSCNGKFLSESKSLAADWVRGAWHDTIKRRK